MHVEINHHPQFRVCRILCSTVLGLAGNHSTWPWLWLGMTLLCSETLVSDMHHISVLFVPGFGSPVLLWKGQNGSMIDCSAVWCSAADTHIKLLDRLVRSACFLTMDVFKCSIAHCRSLAVLCILSQIRCDPMLPLYGARPVRHVSVRVTLVVLVA